MLAHLLMTSLAALRPHCSLDRRTLLAGAAVGSSSICSPSQAAHALARASPTRATGVIAGGSLPLTVGLGTCLVSPNDVSRTVALGTQSGYRVFDTAQRYGNEAGVGKAIKQASADGILKREECFVTTKVWNDNMGYKETIASVKNSARSLDLGVIDLVLIHWPGRFIKRDGGTNDAINTKLRRETWEALETLKRDGVVAQIGVSNFGERHLRELEAYAMSRPAVNQFEVHPYNTRDRLVDYCAKEGILVNSYCPIGGKGNKKQSTDELLKDPKLVEIAAAHGKTPVQTILRWHLQRGLTPVPKASSREHICENIDVYDFELARAEMVAISGLNQDRFTLFDADALA